MPTYYYSGQGEFLLADRTPAGKPKGFEYVGNVPSMQIDIEITKFEHKESRSGQRAVDVSLVQEKRGSFTMTVEALSPANLAVGLWGQHAMVAGGAAVGESVVAYAGKRVTLAHPNLDPNVAPVVNAGAFTEGDDYEVDYTNGVLVILEDGDIADETMLTVDYTYLGYANVEAFTVTSMEKWLRFEGINTLDGDRVTVDIFKASFDPMSGYQLINEELGQIEMRGSVLYDAAQPGVSKFFTQRNYTPGA